MYKWGEFSSQYWGTILRTITISDEVGLLKLDSVYRAIAFYEKGGEFKQYNKTHISTLQYKMEEG